MGHDNSDDEELDHRQYSPSMSSDKKLFSTMDGSALPATASWGKTSTPGTPTTKNSNLPDRALTPDTFGPPLAVAVAQQQLQLQQQKQLSPSVLKRKLEKKKRKEALQKQRKEEDNHHHPPPPPQQQHPIKPTITKYDSLVTFVLGDAFEEMCSPTTTSVCEEEAPIGVTSLYDSDEDVVIAPPAPSSLQSSMFALNLSEGVSPLEYLIQSIPTPTPYQGTFNPFSHQLLRSVTASQSPPTASFESPVRKHSRFGFAQF